LDDECKEFRNKFDILEHQNEESIADNSNKISVSISEELSFVKDDGIVKLFECEKFSEHFQSKISLKNTAKRNTKPLVYGTADMTSPY
jgi:hypothetical protein